MCSVDSTTQLIIHSALSTAMSSKPTILVQLDTDRSRASSTRSWPSTRGWTTCSGTAGSGRRRCATWSTGPCSRGGRPTCTARRCSSAARTSRPGEAVLEAVKATFFAGFRVSVLLDANGATRRPRRRCWRSRIRGVRAARSTGPRRRPRGDRAGRAAGRAAARAAGARVAVGSRRLDRAQETADRSCGDGEASSAVRHRRPGRAGEGPRGAEIVVSAGAAGATLLPEAVRRRLTRLKVAVDLNAVPPAGIEGVKPTDKGAERDGVRAWGRSGSAAPR